MPTRGPKDTVGPVEPDQPGPEGDVDTSPADAPDEDGNAGVDHGDGWVDPDAVDDELATAADEAAAANDSKPSAENPYAPGDTTTPQDDELGSDV